MGILNLKYPHEGYRKILAKIVDYFKEYPGVYAVVLTGSLARNKAVTGSCIDIYVFLQTRQYDALASTVSSRKRAYSSLGGEICYYNDQVEGGMLFNDVRVDVGYTDGKCKVYAENSFDITRDEFETTIGNLFVYALVLHEKGRKYQQLKKQYLPFYDGNLRKARLEGTAEECNYKIWKTRWLAERGEFLAALEAFLEAQRIFLQHLFIKERRYPIDYVKWLKEQCSQILMMPALYQELVALIDGLELTEEALGERCETLKQLFAKYGSSVLSLP